MRLLCLLLAAVSAALAQRDPGTLLRNTFDQDTEGWIAMGPNATVSASHALKFTYELGAKQFSAAVTRVDLSLARLQRIRFRVKTDHDTALGFYLSERKPGGGYTVWFGAPANTWQPVELTPGDFALNDGPTDPVDPDGKLDLDQVD